MVENVLYGFAVVTGNVKLIVSKENIYLEKIQNLNVGTTLNHNSPSNNS